MVQFYKELGNDYLPMLNLVNFLIENQYASSLFPLTSMSSLIVGRAADFGAGDSQLTIKFDWRAGQFFFSYSTGRGEEPWEVSCICDDARATLERILVKRLAWFSGAPLKGTPR